MSLIQLQKLGDERGSLVALEDQKNVPFPIRRVYYLFGTKADVKRGLHAHHNLKQMIIAVRDLMIQSLMWREMYEFSEDCVLMVLADAHYDETDYIRDYKEFVEISRNGKE